MKAPQNAPRATGILKLTDTIKMITDRAETDMGNIVQEELARGDDARPQNPKQIH